MHLSNAMQSRQDEAKEYKKWDREHDMYIQEFKHKLNKIELPLPFLYIPLALLFLDINLAIFSLYF